MKKFLVLMLVIAFSTGVIAQQDPVNQQPGQINQKVKVAESVQMKGGKVWLTRDGKTTLVNDEVTLGGTRVKADGSVVTKDGNPTNLKEGDLVNSDGTIARAMDKPSDKKVEIEPKY